MAARFVCPSCWHVVEDLAKDLVGKRIKCPSCRTPGPVERVTGKPRRRPAPLLRKPRLFFVVAIAAAGFLLAGAAVVYLVVRSTPRTQAVQASGVPVSAPSPIPAPQTSKATPLVPTPAPVIPPAAEDPKDRRQRLRLNLLEEAAAAESARLARRWEMALGLYEVLAEHQAAARAQEQRAAEELLRSMPPDDKELVRSISQQMAAGDHLDEEEMRLAKASPALRPALRRFGLERAKQNGVFDKIKAMARSPEKLEWMRWEFGLLTPQDQDVALLFAGRLKRREHMDEEDLNVVARFRVLRNLGRENPEPAPAADCLPDGYVQAVRAKAQKQTRAMARACDLCFSSRNYRDAASELGDACRADPTFMEGLSLRGAIYALQGPPDYGVRDCTSAIQAHPTNHWALISRALCYMQQGARQMAQADFDRAVQLYPPLRAYAELFE